MDGRDPSDLTLSIDYVGPVLDEKEGLLWIRRRPESNDWVRAQVNIPVQSQAYNIMFKAELLPDSHNTIGLDDISFTDGVCPSTPVCGFEVWMNIKLTSLISNSN